MILVVGEAGCSKCKMACMMLDKKNVEYKYVLLGDLPSEDSKEYLSKARQAGALTLPMVFKNGELISLQEV